MYRLALTVLSTAVLLAPSEGAKSTAAQHRDDSYSSYGREHKEEAQPYSSYAPEPQQAYMVYPAAPMPTYGMMEEEKEEETEPKTKEEKKCAVKLVLPPLIIITIFIGLILLHLVSPTLMPAFADPVVLPFVAFVNALAAQGPGLLFTPVPAVQFPLKGRENNVTMTSGGQSMLGSFEQLMHLTVAVTAAVDDEQCFARLLCHAGTNLPKNTSWAKSMKWLLPKEYQSYVTVVEKARVGGLKGCARDYPCPQVD